MNPMIQPDFHPDADALNAFAEQALPVADRARILAHMASCARCREVVYLAQAASEPGFAPAVLPAAPHRERFWGALAKWRVALIPATALAATGAVVLWVQLRPVPAPTQMARMSEPQPGPLSSATAKMVQQKSAPPPAAIAPRQSVAVPLRPSAASNTHLEPPAQPERQKAMLPAAGATDPNPSAFTASSASPAAAAPVGRERALGGVHLDAHSASMARYAPRPEPPTPPSALSLTPSAISPQQQQPQPVVLSPTHAGIASTAAESPAPPPPNIVAMSQASSVAAPPPARLELAPQPLNGFAAMHLAKRVKLPSGLTTVSSAALLNRLLAVDSAGAVFLSQDAGKHWETVNAQWSGRAIQVQAPPQGLYRPKAANAATTAETAPAPDNSVNHVSEQPPAPPPPPPASDTTPAAARAKAAPPIPAMLFRLVTDRHQTWVSVDGKVWREQ